MARLRATTAGLELVDKARIRKGWNRQAAIWHIQANVGLSTLKRFWTSDRPKVMGGSIKRRSRPKWWISWLMVLAHNPLPSIGSSGEGLSAGSNLDHFWTQLDLDLGITPQLNLHTARHDWTDPSRLVAKFQAERTLVVVDVVESNPVERAEDIPAWEPADRATLWAELQNQTLEPSSAKISQSTLIESIASLDRKCLIEIMTEQENVLFTLQPMVMKYVRRNWA